MTRCSPYVEAIALVLLGAVPLRPQRANQSSDSVIRVTVDLVQVDAVVTDLQGRHVADLTPDDFQVFEDGKAQQVTHFSYVPGAMKSTPAHSAAGQPDGSPAEGALVPAKALRKDQVRRAIVMIADDLGLSPADIPGIRRAMKNFVDGQMQPGDLVSVMTTSGGMGIMAQLTNDKRQLLASIDRIHYTLGRTGMTWYEPISQPTADRLYQKEINKRLDAARSPGLSMGTLGALAYAIQGLREIPGRKAIAFFSEGFPQSAGGIVQLANRASVVIYTLDPRGFVSFDATALDAGPAAGGLRRAHERKAAFRVTQKGLEQLAVGTGGLFFHDNNDLDQGLTNALDDMNSYYLLGYQPQRTDFDQVRGLPQFHKIEVKVLRPGLLVRSRNGFLGVPDSEIAEPAAGSSGADELRKALSSPFQANGFPVHLSAFYAASKEKDIKTGRRSTVLRAMLAIDAHALKFNDTPEGRKQLSLDIVAAVYGANNEVVGNSDRTFNPAMMPDEMNRTVASGLVYGFEIEIPKPGPYQLRVAAWDANAQKAGAASVFVEVPDFNLGGIALSSVQLYDADSKRNEELTHLGVLGAGSPVTRVFASGALLKYDCTVYGSQIHSQTGKQEIDVAVGLFRGPEHIFSGEPIPLAIAGGSSAAAVHATGQIKLPSTLPPGEYALELIVHDRSEKRRSSGASQWVDFTLI